MSSVSQEHDAKEMPSDTVHVDAVRTINNNIGDLKIGENDDTKNGERSSLDLIDDNASDNRSAEAAFSESSGTMFGSDDIIFEDEVTFDRDVTRSNSVDFLKEKAIELLQQELNNARKELKLKDKECKELTDVRTKVESELEELTASLFEEAHKMVHEANMKQFLAEKKIKAANGEIEALQTEVSALKSLVLTSTPSNPNPQLHPQLIKKKTEVLSSPIRKHKKSKVVHHPTMEMNKHTKPIIKMAKEIDLVIMEQLSDWLKTTLNPPKQNGTNQSEKTSVFNHNAHSEAVYQNICEETNAPVTSHLLKRIEEEDIIPCLTFPNHDLASIVIDNVRNNSLSIEPLASPKLQKCVLSGATICCKHRIKCGESDEWFPISQSCRTRVATVCDFLTYVRYVQQGLVKHTKEQMYWEMNRLRREMALAKLGYFKEE